MKMRIIIMLAFAVAVAGLPVHVQAESTRKERRLIMKGNDMYKQSKFAEAQSFYEQALVENGNSAEARYNLGLSQIKQVKNLADTTSASRQVKENARQNLTAVANLAKSKPGLAAKANYNLGNIDFHEKEFQKAIDHYKQALRIDPDDEHARKNLRIAQKNLQQQNQDNKQDKQDQNKDQQKDQQDQNKDQQDQQNQQNQQDQEKKQQPQQNELNPQAAASILQAVDNKENQTRARVNRASKGDKSAANGRNIRKW